MKKRRKRNLSGARTHVLKVKVSPKLFGPATCFFLLSRKNPSSYTRHMHAWHTALGTQRALTWMMIYPNPDPAQGTQSCGKPCRFQWDTHEQKTPTFRTMDDTWYKVTSQKETRKIVFLLPHKKSFERTPRAIHWTDRTPRRLCPDGLLCQPPYE